MIIEFPKKQIRSAIVAEQNFHLACGWRNQIFMTPIYRRRDRMEDWPFVTFLVDQATRNLSMYQGYEALRK